MKKYFFLPLITSLFSFDLLASNIIKTDKLNDLKLTIYNNNQMMVEENSSIKIPDKGKYTVVFPNVPKNIVLDSIIPTFTFDKKDVQYNLYSQKYKYNIISLDNLIKMNIGERISFSKGEEDHIGVLLASNPIIVKDKDNSIYTIDKKDIIFDSIPEDMATKPSLFWNMNFNQPSTMNINLKYLSTGISWKSNYVLSLNDNNTLDLNSWITVKNNSGTSYENAQLTFLSGNIHKVSKPIAVRNIMYKNKGFEGIETSTSTVSEESFSGYHIYKIPFKENLKDKEVSQILFIHKNNIKYNKNLEGTIYLNNSVQNQKFNSTISIKNNKDNNFEIPLPSGIVRVFDKDNSGESHFVGESFSKNIPINNEMKVNIGKDFDVTYSNKILEYKKYRENTTLKMMKRIKSEIFVKNDSKEKKNIKLKIITPMTFKSENQKNNIFYTNCSANCSYKQIDFNKYEYIIDLEPNSSYTIKIKISY